MRLLLEQVVVGVVLMQVVVVVLRGVGHYLKILASLVLAVA
jgi:hypothetical protein